jgi:hypothetical protein
MTTQAGQQMLLRFDVGSPGAVSLHVFTAGSVTYDTNTLGACLEFAGESPCNPAPFPNPAYWSISANDLAHHGGYQIRVSPRASSGALLGLDVAWNGSRHIALSGLDLAGGCTHTTGYKAGCGLRFEFTNSAAGTAGISAGPGLLHLKVKDKSSGAVACDTKFTGSAACPLPDPPRKWTGYLYPEDGQPISPAAMTLGWP